MNGVNIVGLNKSPYLFILLIPIGIADDFRYNQSTYMEDICVSSTTTSFK